MAFNNKSTEAKCPFYQGFYTGRDVVCEGIISATNIKNIFVNTDRCKEHMHKYCESMNYRDCPVFAATMKKYETK